MSFGPSVREDPFSKIIRVRIYPLAQDTYWINAKRKLLVLDELPPEYRYNILHWIIKNSESSHNQYLLYLAGKRIQDLAYGWYDPHGSPQLQIDPEVTHLEWIETTPLVIKLRRTLEQDKADGYIYF